MQSVANDPKYEPLTSCDHNWPAYSNLKTCFSVARYKFIARYLLLPIAILSNFNFQHNDVGPRPPQLESHNFPTLVTYVSGFNNLPISFRGTFLFLSLSAFVFLR